MNVWAILPIGPGERGREGGCWIVELSLICHLQNSKYGKIFRRH